MDRKFLKPFALTVAMTLASVQASASITAGDASNTLLKLAEMSIQDGLVIERANSPLNTQMAGHTSHASHASHASHGSHCSSYSYCG